MAIVYSSAPRASVPYPWVEFMRWANEQGLSAEEFQTLLENGQEPIVTMGVGLTLRAEPYPGLPSLEDVIQEVSPSIKFIQGVAR